MTSRVEVGQPRIHAADSAEARGLLETANRRFEAGQFPEAIVQYRALLDKNGNRTTNLIRYNLALALRRAERLDESSRELQTLIGDSSTTDALRRDASFLWVEVAMAQRNWFAAQTALDGISGKLEAAEELERSVKQAVIFRELGVLFKAEATLNQAWRFFQQLNGDDRNYLLQWGAEIRYLLAELSHRNFAALPIRLPQTQLEADLEQKAKALLVTQTRYFDTMKLGDPERASAAAYQIGLLYAQFYDVLLNAPTPSVLDQEGRSVYREELEKKIVTLLEKSLSLHRRNILMAERLGLHNQWIKRSIEQADALQKKIESREPIVVEPLEPKITPEANVVPRHVL